MSQVSNLLGSTTGTKSDSKKSNNDVFNDVDLGDFLKLMITELQNQDPLNPLENDQLVAQLGQIRSVAATDKLTSTLDGVLLGQNVSSATNLIGAKIDGVSDDGQKVTGFVKRVSISGGEPKLQLDLNPSASISNDKEGAMEEGEYEYLVTWRDKGKLFAVDPLASDGGSISISGKAGEQAVELSNLPETTSAKQVYRREKGSGEYKLVGQIDKGKDATFLDIKANEDLSTALTGNAQMIEPQREFEVSLKNVGEIRPRVAVQD